MNQIKQASRKRKRKIIHGFYDGNINHFCKYICQIGGARTF